MKKYLTNAAFYAALILGFLVAVLSNEWELYYLARWGLIFVVPVFMSIVYPRISILLMLYFIPGLIINYEYCTNNNLNLIAGIASYVLSSLCVYYLIIQSISFVNLKLYANSIRAFVLIMLSVNFLVIICGIFGINVIDYEPRGITPERFAINNPLEFYYICLGMLLISDRMYKSSSVYSYIFLGLNIAYSKSRFLLLLVFFRTLLTKKYRFVGFVFLFALLLPAIFLLLSENLDGRFNPNFIADDPSLQMRIVKIENFVNYDFDLKGMFFGYGANSYKVLTGENVSLEFLLIDIIFSFGFWGLFFLILPLFKFLKNGEYNYFDIAFVLYGFCMLPISYATPILYAYMAVVACGKVDYYNAN